MTPQFLLRVAGIAFLVISALFVLLAVHYYLTQNIKAVMDDLSGKTRARGVAGTRTRTASERGRGVARRPSRTAAATPGQVEPAAQLETGQPGTASAAPMPAMPVFDDEDDVGTVLVAVAPVASVQEDGTSTILVDDASTMGTAGSDVPAPSRPYNEIEGTAADGTLFRITRRVVMIHSQEVIAASEER